MAYQDIARRQKLPQASVETYEDNINWLHELLLDEDRIEMIQKMEQLPNVFAMSTPRYKLTLPPFQGPVYFINASGRDEAI